MNGSLREAWAWTVSALSMIGAWLVDHLDHWLALLGIVVAVLTAIERYYAIRLRKRQIAICAPAKPPK